MLKRILLWLIILTFAAHFVEAATLDDLLWGFRQRIGEPDSGSSIISDTAAMRFLDMAMDKVVPFGGFLPQRCDIAYSPDSMKYSLPTDFKRCSMVVAYDGEQWHAAVNNPGFITDVDKYQYFIWWENADQAELYLKGSYFYTDQTVRIHYLARAPNMDARTDSCYVPDDLHVFIIEEAVSYYEQAKKNHAVFQLLNAIVRQDMGIKVSAGSGK